MDSESSTSQTVALQLSRPIYAPPLLAAPPVLPAPPTPCAPSIDRKEILKRHAEWLESNGDAGERADFSGAHLGGADLTDANLEDAWLNKTILKGADLLLANLQRASLMQANLQGANLLGAKLQEADLQAALLDNAVGLQTEQLAGANLFGASLPAEASVLDAVKDLATQATTAGWVVLSMLLLNAAAALRVITTSDAQILGNAPVLPFRIFGVFPMDQVFLVAPTLILGLYVWLHLYLQRLWESTSTMPAIFPDGQPLDRMLPWFVGLIARTHLKWLRNKNSPVAALEAALSEIILYWIVPLTMILFWARYLTFQDLHGTALHILLVVASCAAAVHFSRAMKRTLAVDSTPTAVPLEPPAEKGILRYADITLLSTLAFGTLIFLLSVGVILGTPRDEGTMPGSHNYNVQAWAADAFWLIGYSPAAQVTGTDISQKPAHWTDSAEDLATVRGARLSKARLRNIQAYGAFFAKADLWQADMQGADLSEADLRDVKARQARLRSAVLDRAKLNGAVLQQADLQQTSLTRANLEKADLSYASLEGATLNDSKLDGASLYRSDLHGAALERASMQQTDLREANLAGADLTAANLGNAYLSSAKMAGAKLENTELDEALLTQADLRGADLRNAKVAGAAFNGANLQGADLRGALGLSAMQVCSAAERDQVQLDEALQHDVETACGAAGH